LQTLNKALSKILCNFFLAFFEEKLNKLFDHLNITGSRISGLTGYPAGQSGIRPDTGYKKKAGYLVHP
jgi:hypothetical protein